MTNDQLIKLSAKAIGLCLLDAPKELRGIVSSRIHTDDGGGWWNPLKSNDDVVRLIAVLKINVDSDCQTVWCEGHQQGVDIDNQPHHAHQEAMYALRLAVTTLAARIGEQRKDEKM